MEKNPLLNEQHPGVLSGLNKVDVAKEHGVEAVMKWRRSHDFAPPPLPLDGLRQICVSDTRYRDIEVPRTECLLDCKARVDRVWDETIAPALLEGALTHPFPPYVTPHFPYISQAFTFEVFFSRTHPFLPYVTLASFPYITGCIFLERRIRSHTHPFFPYVTHPFFPYVTLPCFVSLTGCVLFVALSRRAYCDGRFAREHAACNGQASGRGER